MAGRDYSVIVADMRRRYPHTVRLPNAGGWRQARCRQRHHELTREEPTVWYELDADDRMVSVHGFASAELAARFRQWADTAGIDWTVPPCRQQEPRAG